MFSKNLSLQEEKKIYTEVKTVFLRLCIDIVLSTIAIKSSKRITLHYWFRDIRSKVKRY